MSDKTSTKDEFDRMTDPTYDPTDDPKYIRKEFRYTRDVHASNITAGYAAGKASTLIYDAPLDADGLKCFHLCQTLMNPLSCALCNSAALSKYTFHRIYDDHIETNIPTSCLFWIMDNTSVAYFDRDWAQKFEKADICQPVCTHCMICPDGCGMCGATVIGHGTTNGICCAGGRRTGVSCVPGASCSGGPCLLAIGPIGASQWFCFPFIQPGEANTFIEKLTAQREVIATANNIVVGKAGLTSAPDAADQSRE